MWHTAGSRGMGVRSWGRKGNRPLARVTSPRGSVPIPSVRGQGPGLLCWPVGQGVLPGLRDPAGGGVSVGIVHIVGPRYGHPHPTTAIIPPRLAPRASLHCVCLTAANAWCSVTRMLTCWCRCSDWRVGEVDGGTGVAGRCGAGPCAPALEVRGQWSRSR